VMKATLPSAIYCPSCRKKMRVRRLSLFFTGYVTGFLLLVVAFLYAHRTHIGTTWQRIVVTGALFVLLEFVISVVVTRHATFEKLEREAV